jgi:hypothetical protein
MIRFRLLSIVLALASFLAWALPAAAINLDTFTPFQAVVTCNGAPNCSTSLPLPDKITVLEYISFGCVNIPFGQKLETVQVETTINGVQAFHFLELPVAATLGDPAHGNAAGGQVVRIYAGPNSTINVEAFVTGSAPAFGCGFTFSGEQSPLLPP